MTDVLERYGWNDHWAALAAEHRGTPGRVVRQDRGWVQVATADGIVSAEVRARRTGVPVVGDWVVFDDAMVSAILERDGALRRADAMGDGVQVLAANLDLVLVVLGLDRPVKAGRIQRAMAQAYDAGAQPLAVLTKADTVDDPEAIRQSVEDDHPGLEVYVVSSTDGEGIAALEARVTGRTVALFGESGAGKSTLLNALAGDTRAETGAVRSSDARGRHTTTRRELYVLADGTVVVDTPGVRSLGVVADVESIDATFPDIEELAMACRFGDCTHDHEPGCAVNAAVDDGTLPPARLEAYRTLVSEAEWAAMPDHERRRAGGRPPTSR